MRKFTLAFVAFTILFAAAATLVAAYAPYWNWKCYDSYVDSMYCGTSGCRSPRTGENCTAYCNGQTQVIECLNGCQYSFCDDEGW
jgi:hypothetical protein